MSNNKVRSLIIFGGARPSEFNRKLFEPPSRHLQAVTSPHILGDAGIGREDHLVWTFGEALFSRYPGGNQWPENLNHSMIKESLPQIVVVVFSDHGLEYFHPLISKEFEDFAAAVNLLLLVVFALGVLLLSVNSSRAWPESRVEQQHDSSDLLFV